MNKTVTMGKLLLLLLCAGAANVAAVEGERLMSQDGAGYQILKQWGFNDWEDPEGWVAPPELGGTAVGGALWITIDRGDRKGGLPHFPIANSSIKLWGKYLWPLSAPPIFDSPSGLSVDAGNATKVRMRVLNRSPETDGYVIWRTADKPDEDAGRMRFTMRPYYEEWQEVVAHIDGAWQGTIAQIRIQPGTYFYSGDVFFDSIAITNGPPRPAIEKPDVNSAAVVPKVTLPGITQGQFADAFNVLDECLVTDLPAFGFHVPFMSPGGGYHPGWWQLDTSLNLEGSKWVNQDFCEGVMRGFFNVQSHNPDGRIDLFSGAASRGMPMGFSSSPRYFEIGWTIARRTDDAQLRADIYDSFVKYLEFWWTPVKRDTATGLITAIFEESFSETLSDPQTLAAVDLNVAVALGFGYAAQLAEELGLPEEAAEHQKRFEALKSAINTYCWDEEEGVYYNYNVREQQRRERLICTTFDPLRAGIASPEQTARLLEKLVDPALFNWGERPLTSVAKTHPHYNEATGPYDGTAWFGDIWTMRNVPVILGLADRGRHDLAAELNWETIRIFNGNYAEYAVPSTGSGEGVQRYGWTASQYVQCIVETLFGVDYGRIEGRLRVFPRVPEALWGETLKLEDVILPTQPETRLDVTLRFTGQSEGEVTLSTDRPLDMSVEVCVPGSAEELSAEDAEGNALDMTPAPDLNNAAGVRFPAGDSWTVRFR